MINVLHLRDTDRVCGPGKTIIETACATDQRAFSQKVGLFLLHREGVNAYEQSARSRGVEVIPIRSAHPYDPRVVLALRRILREYGIDIIHSHDYKSDILTYAVSRLHPIATMTTVHGWILHTVKRRAVVGVSQLALRHFDRVVAVSHATKARVLACGVPESRVAVIHNAIVPNHYDPASLTRGRFRQTLAVPEDAVLIGNIGRLSPEKGQHDFIAAAAALAPVDPRLYFVLVGDGPDRTSLAARVAELGVRDRVLFTGHLNDVKPVYRDLDVLALTSHTEGLPNVVLEALCMGVPVLATDVGGTPEIITSGVSGVLVPARAPEKIAAGLQRMLDDPAWSRKLMTRGQQVVHDHFSFTNRVAKEEALYRELLRTGT